MIEVALLAACITLRVVGAELVVFLRSWLKICTILQSMETKKELIPEEMSQTLLTNKKQRNRD